MRDTSERHNERHYKALKLVEDNKKKLKVYDNMGRQIKKRNSKKKGGAAT